MNRRRAVRLTALGPLLLTGCYGATGPVDRPISDLRQRGGVCAEVAVDSAALTLVTEGRMMRRIDTCMQTGLAGTLVDDGKTPHLGTTVYGSANAPDADANNWQEEAFLNGAPMGKRMMTKDALVPHLSCGTNGCESWSVDLVTWSTPFAPGTYVFRYTYALDTSLVVTNTITLRP
jgi:hypothetical protein